MVVDVKKLKKESSFNIDSPVGTAGIRGTVPAIQVLKLPDGGFTQNTSMLRGEIAFTPRAGGPATFLGPGQSLSIGIGANGLMLPAQLGRVDASVMKAIEAEVEQAAAATGAAPADNEPSSETPQGASEEDAPSEDELNESDDERQASAKGVGDDENAPMPCTRKSWPYRFGRSESGWRSRYLCRGYRKRCWYVCKKQKADSEKKVTRRSTVDTLENQKMRIQFLSDLLPNLDEAVELVDEQQNLGVLTPDLYEKTLQGFPECPCYKF